MSRTTHPGGTIVKRGFVLCAAVALVLGTMAPAISQDKKAGEIKKSDDVKSTASGKAATGRRVEGVVKSIQSDGFVVSGKEQNKERDWAFAITDKTTVKRGEKPAAAEDLKPGDAVTVNYVEQDGKIIAQSVILAGGAKPRPTTERTGTTKK